MSSLSQSYIHTKFSQYYKQNSTSILPPSSLEKREFGFLLLNKRVMIRHKSYKNADALRASLNEIIPSDVYYSSAYYENPSEEMKAKGWLGADLVFDIDADHIPTPCSSVHDIWICKKCGCSSKGNRPQLCDSCGGTKFKERTWPCEICLRASKFEAIKLIDILTADFGISSLIVAFSGHRGYHVHIESEYVHELDSLARKEIVDYLKGIGLEVEFHGLRKSASPDRRVSGPALHEKSWRGRIAKGTYEFLQTASEEELKKAGLKADHRKKLIENKEIILKSWNKKGPWGIIKNISLETWRKIAKYALEKQSVNIDTVVTPDINRLIRLSNTLHGKTGFKKIEIPLNAIEKFDPLKSAIAFKTGEITLHVSNAPEFRIEDTNYGPFKDEKVELPTAVALMLLCKNVARVVD